MPVSGVHVTVSEILHGEMHPEEQPCPEMKKIEKNFLSDHADGFSF